MLLRICRLVEDSEAKHKDSVLSTQRSAPLRAEPADAVWCLCHPNPDPLPSCGAFDDVPWRALHLGRKNPGKGACRTCAGQICEGYERSARSHTACEQRKTTVPAEVVMNLRVVDATLRKRGDEWPLLCASGLERRS